MLGISLPAMVGHLHYLWWWALDYAQDGCLVGYDVEDIAAAAMWDGDPQAFADALLACRIKPGGAGFLERDEDGELRLHDWYDYAGKLIERRENEAERKRSMREAYESGVIRAVRQRDGNHCRYCGKAVNWHDRRGVDGGTYDHIDPNGPSTVDNLVVACRACNSQKGKRTPEEAGMALGPVPTPNHFGSSSGTRSRPRTDLATQPNRTEQNKTAEDVARDADATRSRLATAADPAPSAAAEVIGDDAVSPATFYESLWGARPRTILRVIADSADKLKPSAIKWAMWEAYLAGARGAKYLASILERLENQGLTTAQAAEEHERARRGTKTRASPNGSTEGAPNAGAYQPISDDLVARWRALYPDECG